MSCRLGDRPGELLLLVLGLAVLVWFAWGPAAAGVNQSRTGVMDAFSRNILGDSSRKTIRGKQFLVHPI